MKYISLLGSTGSIGTQTLDIVRRRKEEFKIVALSANNSVDKLYEQVVEFKPQYAVMMDKDCACILKEKLAGYNTKVLSGIEGLEFIAAMEEADIVLTAVMGMVGLKPTISAIRNNKTIALANKETLVSGGDIIKRELEHSSSKLIPVDSEHCAIFQCLNGNDINSVRRLIVTASGGPFRGMDRESLSRVTPQMALKHPKWNMGKKISIDSATLMNKALEVIEAHFLFDMKYDKIDVVVHPQSIVHSMVEYNDGSILAQLSSTDMRHPIQFALDYPHRKLSSIEYLDLFKVGRLDFEEPDKKTFEALELGYHAGKVGGSMPAIMNAANEIAVKLFLEEKIGFLDIIDIVRNSMDKFEKCKAYDIDELLLLDKQVRDYASSIRNRMV